MYPSCANYTIEIIKEKGIIQGIINGSDRLGVSIWLGVFVCLLFLLMKGKNAEIAPGYQVEAVVASTTTINLK